MKIFVLQIKANIFFMKHDDDMLGDIANGILDGLWNQYEELKENSEEVE